MLVFLTIFLPDMVTQAFNSGSWETKAGRSLGVGGQAGLHNEFEVSQGYIMRSCLNCHPVRECSKDYLVPGIQGTSLFSLQIGHELQLCWEVLPCWYSQPNHLFHPSLPHSKCVSCGTGSLGPRLSAECWMWFYYSDSWLPKPDNFYIKNSFVNRWVTLRYTSPREAKSILILLFHIHHLEMNDRPGDWGWGICFILP